MATGANAAIIADESGAGTPIVVHSRTLTGALDGPIAVVESRGSTQTLLGERIAESVAQATDPANLIWVIPAKGSNGSLLHPRRLVSVRRVDNGGRVSLLALASAPLRRHRSCGL